MALIIVESPTKARTFNRILKYSNKDNGKKNDYFVFATMGHIRDLPANRMAIDYEKEVKRSIDLFSRLLEPIMIIILGGIVTVLAVSVLSSIYGAIGVV